MRVSLHINSEIMVCCKAELHYILLLQYDILNCSNSYSYLLQKCDRGCLIMSHHPLFLLFTDITGQQVPFTTYGGAALCPLP